MPVGEQIAILYCGVHGLMRDVPVDQVRHCQEQFLDSMRSSYADVISSLAAGQLEDSSIKVIEEVMGNIADNINKTRRNGIVKGNKDSHSQCPKHA